MFIEIYGHWAGVSALLFATFIVESVNEIAKTKPYKLILDSKLVPQNYINCTFDKKKSFHKLFYKSLL